MSAFGLPPQFEYNKHHLTLPQDTRAFNSSSIPTNGTSFTFGQMIQVDIPRVETLVPDSLSMKYQLSQQATNATTATICGCPVYTPFQRMDTLIGGVGVETLNNANVIWNDWVNLYLDASQKYGMESAYGYNQSAFGSMDSNSYLSTGTLNTNIIQMSAPLNCMISNLKEYLPLYAIPQISLKFTIDSQANIYGTTSANVTVFTIQNFEVCYELVALPSHIKNAVLARHANEPIQIRSLTFALQTNTQIAAATSGNLSFFYNMQYDSIKAILLHMYPAAGAYVNGIFDSLDVTNAASATGSGGQYSFLMGSSMYPNKLINVAQNRAGVFTELKKVATTLGVPYATIYDKANSFAITSAEFNSVSASTAVNPSKFYIGVHTERLHNNDVYWSGVSSKGTGITANINIPAATTVAVTPTLILILDCLLTFDIANQQVAVTQ